MFAQLYSLGVWALDGFVVTTEVDVSGGLPQFAIVGLPDNAVKEATDRVRSAMKNMGFEFPARRITVNLAPADKKKTGSVYDLPVLLGVLAATGQIPELPQDAAFIGELSLDGKIRPVNGALPMAMACEKAGIKKLFLAEENAEEASMVASIKVYGAKTVKDVKEHLNGENVLQPCSGPVWQAQGDVCCADFKDVRGQLEARRALEIAAAGMHNAVLIGPPGAGKSMLAKRMPGIMPLLENAQALEISAIYSIAGLAGKKAGLNYLRPFRSPHHSSSAAALAGGGSVPKPGEISLAHNGVLFLDELPEFSRDALEILRQPMEDGVVNVSRVSGNAQFPSRFMLLAAMNPCPCGYFGHSTRDCRCSQSMIDRYLQKVSGPLLDRIDLHVEVQQVEYEDISSTEAGEKSADILERVIKARRFADERKRNSALNVPNAYLEGEDLRNECKLSEGAARMMKNAFERMGLSARAHDKVLKISRTIADLAASDILHTVHVQEAVQYRNLDRKYWYSR